MTDIRHTRTLQRTLTSGAALASASLLFVVAGCTSKASSENSVAVTATNSTCEVAKTEFESGTHVFRVTNKGSDVTEVYVYGEGDRVIGEVENIGPGTSRDLKVELTGGDFEIACKPGQKGSGIRTPISVSGEVVAAPVPDRTVEVGAKERTFTGLEDFTASPGEVVQFLLTNNDDTDEHELEFIGPDEVPVGEVAPLAPGASGSVIVTFDQSGTFTFLCDVDNHAAEGMKGQFETSSADTAATTTAP